MMRKHLGLLVVLCLLFSLCGCQNVASDGLCVEVLDVGQSDCTVLRCGDAVLMIDTGTATERSAVQGYLADKRMDAIDYVLLTHPHEDHIGNARMLLESYTVGALILPPAVVEDTGYELILEAARHRNVPCETARAGNTYQIGHMTLEVLFADEQTDDLNNGSIMFRVLYKDTVFLFTGDAEEEAEKALLEAVPAEKLDCDFLKAGHHGSSTSTAEELLRSATPAHVAISCGENNDYGFPHKALLERLAAVGAQWHRTDEEGTLCYISDGTTVIYQETKKG